VLAPLDSLALPRRLLDLRRVLDHPYSPPALTAKLGQQRTARKHSLP
jgi:hypothetical protein